jgi:hypothetical protein
MVDRQSGDRLGPFRQEVMGTDFLVVIALPMTSGSMIRQWISGMSVTSKVVSGTYMRKLRIEQC